MLSPTWSRHVAAFVSTPEAKVSTTSLFVAEYTAEVGLYITWLAETSVLLVLINS